MKNGIDISEFNKDIDFKKLKSQNIEFIIIRATYGRFKEDKCFKKYVKGCIENDIPFGFYYYSYATNEEEAKEEATFFIKTISPYKEQIKFPCCIDMEDSDNYKKDRNCLTKEIVSNVIKVAIEKIKDSGFVAMVYANLDFYKNYIDEEVVKNVPKWIAWWNVEENKIDKTKYTIWQYKSTGIVEGISTKVDMNKCYFDYEKYITYLNNVIKINEIKLKTMLQDITIQFISCYKFGQDLINKIYDRLKKPKIKDIKKDLDKMKKIVKRELDISDRTFEYLENYIYSDELFKKLYSAICEVEK